jgi:hypothetical protein
MADFVNAIIHAPPLALAIHLHAPLMALDSWLAYVLMYIPAASHKLMQDASQKKGIAHTHTAMGRRVFIGAKGKIKSDK